jgi:integrase
MPRRVRDAALDTRTARSKLKPRGKPYFRVIEPGLHLGYRKPRRGAGAWVVRHYLGEQAYETETIGTTDDFSDADGVAILSYWHAQQKAREQMVARAHTAAGKHGPLTVGDAMNSYIEFLEGHRKSASDVRYCDSSVIRPRLGNMLVADLTTEELQRWHAELAKAPARLRTRPGEKQNHRAPSTDPESKRQRQNTANRQLVMLKAALNRAWRSGKAPSNVAWTRVQPFRGVDAARARYLTVAEAQRLVNACDPDFRSLAQAALATGARYGELAALEVHDFNPDTGTIHVRTSKSGKGRHIVLADEGVGLFTRLTAGRAGNELILLKANGKAWRKSHQRNPMRDACTRAHIKPAMGFHGLRHTWASLAVMNGTPLLVAAKNLGHRDTRMVEKFYGHLAPNFIADAIRAGAPKFGFKPDRKVAALPR